MTLIAEDVLLLILDDEKGKVTGTSPVAPTLGGAVLVELALAEAVEVTEKSGFWHSAKVRPVPGAQPDDPVLRHALDIVAEKERSAQDLVTRLGKGLDVELGDRLVERGILRKEKGRILGLLPTTRWPTADATHEQEVRRELGAVLVQGLTPTPRTGALVAILSAADRAHKVVDRQGLRAGEVRKRAKEVAKGSWAATAVRDAIAASAAATTAAITAATAAAATGGGS
jgi:hypothetical protein